MRLRTVLVAAVLALAPAVALAPPAQAVTYIQCGGLNYFDSWGNLIRPVPTNWNPNSSQYGKAWCIGLGRWISPSSWFFYQRGWELYYGR